MHIQLVILPGNINFVRSRGSDKSIGSNFFSARTMDNPEVEYSYVYKNTFVYLVSYLRNSALHFWYLYKKIHSQFKITT